MNDCDPRLAEHHGALHDPPFPFRKSAETLSNHRIAAWGGENEMSALGALRRNTVSLCPPQKETNAESTHLTLCEKGVNNRSTRGHGGCLQQVRKNTQHGVEAFPLAAFLLHLGVTCTNQTTAQRATGDGRRSCAFMEGITGRGCLSFSQPLATIEPRRSIRRRVLRERERRGKSSKVRPIFGDKGARGERNRRRDADIYGPKRARENR